MVEKCANKTWIANNVINLFDDKINLCLSLGFFFSSLLCLLSSLFYISFTRV